MTWAKIGASQRETDTKLDQSAKESQAKLDQEAHRLRREFALEFAAETAARALLEDERWPMRSFETIRRHLGGFENDDLRELLVRAGAVRFTSNEGEELWGLLKRNHNKLGVAGLTPRPQH